MRWTMTGLEHLRAAATGMVAAAEVAAATGMVTVAEVAAATEMVAAAEVAAATGMVAVAEVAAATEMIAAAEVATAEGIVDTTEMKAERDMVSTVNAARNLLALELQNDTADGGILVEVIIMLTSNNMTHVLQVLAAVMVTSAATNGLHIFETVGRGITKEVAAIKQPLDESLTFIGTTACGHVKKLIGVDYEQVQGAREPDLNQLSLNFFSEAFRITYNITAAAELIPLTRGYDPHRKLIIFLHGFTDDPTKDNFKNVGDAFLSQGEYNILALDSSSLIRWFYLRSTTHVRFIGEKLGQVLASMVKGGMSPAAIHLVGHSLGAHISGFAGKTFTKLTGLRVGRITGLDPAGPCFSNLLPELRLKESDADFVDAIHTDSGVYGMKDPVGHVDFYVNGGSQQPNCLFQTCSHGRVVLLYAESIANVNAFLAVRCNDWDSFRIGRCDSETRLMGYGCTPDTRGIYFLRTGEDPPYGLGKTGTVYVNNEGIIRSIGAVGSSLIS